MARTKAHQTARQRMSRARRALAKAEHTGDAERIAAAQQKLAAAQSSMDAVKQQGHACATDTPGDVTLTSSSAPETAAPPGDTQPETTAEQGDVTPVPADKEPDPPGLEARIRMAYQELSTKPQDWIRLARLRPLLGGADKSDVDKALITMMRSGAVYLVPDSNRKVLTGADHEAAIRIGGEDKHLIAIEPPEEPADKPSAPATPDKKRSTPGDTRPAARKRETPPQQGDVTPETRQAPARPAPPPVSGRMSDQPVTDNGWGDPAATDINYHDDGAIGTAVHAMGPDARMDVDGQPLANRVGRIATDIVTGRRTAQDGLREYKALRDRLPAGSQARDELDYAIRKIDGPESPAPEIPDGTPEPLRRLIHDLHAVPIVRKDPSREMRDAVRLAEDAAAGRIRGRRLADEVRNLGNRRHESQGDAGKFEIDHAIDAAAKQLRQPPPEPGTAGDVTPPSEPAGTRRSRRVDGKPETEAETKIFDLRESGYTGPIDERGEKVTSGPAVEVLRQLDQGNSQVMRIVHHGEHVTVRADKLDGDIVMDMRGGRMSVDYRPVPPAAREKREQERQQRAQERQLRGQARQQRAAEREARRQERDAARQERKRTGTTGGDGARGGEIHVTNVVSGTINGVQVVANHGEIRIGGKPARIDDVMSKLDRARGTDTEGT